MKIAICDDCLKDIEYLKKLIQDSKICLFNVEFAEFTSGEELLSCYSDFDAIFCRWAVWMAKKRRRKYESVIRL